MSERMLILAIAAALIFAIGVLLYSASQFVKQVRLWRRDERNYRSRMS